MVEKVNEKTQQPDKHPKASRPSSQKQIYCDKFADHGTSAVGVIRPLSLDAVLGEQALLLGEVPRVVEMLGNTSNADNRKSRCH